jgi:BirA family transcriptional regulator, biotin operon repressor / biotin---[acetyl-CoA-carboxylase] ligase
VTPSRWADLDRPPLDVRAVRRGLIDYGIWRDVRVVDETGSTNADVAQLARAGEAAGLVLVAEHQTAGRGRLDRVWTAPPRSGLTLSMLLRPADMTPEVMPHLRAGLSPLSPTAVPPGRWPLLPLVVGVGVATALAAVAEVEVGLKWPNDVMIAGRKVGGILAEQVDSAGPSGAAVVVGVGLNVSLRAAELPVPTAISLALAGASCTDRSTLLKAVLRAIGDEYLGWRAVAGDGAASVLPRYRELCVTLGRDIRADVAGRTAVEGRAVDIDDDGGLVLQTAEGQRTVLAGDVSHVR